MRYCVNSNGQLLSNLLTRCQFCRREMPDDLFLLKLSVLTIAREGCRSCSPKQIDVFSAEIPLSSPRSPQLKSKFKQDSENQTNDVEHESMMIRVPKEPLLDNDCSQSLEFNNDVFPNGILLDVFSAKKLEPGDKISLLEDGERKLYTVTYHFKKVKVLSMASRNENEQALTHQSLVQKKARILLKSYREKR